MSDMMESACASPDSGMLHLSGSTSDMDEPCFRSRANTWHGRSKEAAKYYQPGSQSSTPTSVDDGDPEVSGSGGHSSGTGGCDSPLSTVIERSASISSGSGPQKSICRRNAWGNLSYAELITKAIESTPMKRMTLSEVYNWIVENVPFFKDKGFGNSSAGWKVGILRQI